ncbi:hypothetical protein L798_13387 [Zootermopsis nevadensis]|uniref:Uncharacterized protein n=1 Tax=Zootermopsis nevadensis TaxID=136037 RepID=A0A067QRG8_ZOONE|nr:hypothetical protein L798_13387 [Zootermopsis nevadensis]
MELAQSASLQLDNVNLKHTRLCTSVKGLLQWFNVKKSTALTNLQTYGKNEGNGKKYKRDTEKRSRGSQPADDLCPEL